MNDAGEMQYIHNDNASIQSPKHKKAIHVFGSHPHTQIKIYKLLLFISLFREK